VFPGGFVNDLFSKAQLYLPFREYQPRSYKKQEQLKVSNMKVRQIHVLSIYCVGK
jgi:hypothetical protein